MKRIANSRRALFGLAGIGVAAGLVAAFTSGQKKPAEAPVFSPAPNPYAKGIYANGIIESFQTNGENINIYPEVGGTVTKVLVAEGGAVTAGTPLLQLDDTVQRATAEQLKSQAEAAAALLEELKAQPRKETLDVARAQVDAARAGVRSVQDQLTKVQSSYRLNPKSVARIDLDNAMNSVKVAHGNLEVALKQYELTKAGAWIYDIRNQESQAAALQKQYESSKALLAKYTLRAPSDGVVLSIKTAVGSYVSPQGVYGTYTQGFSPIIVMGGSEQFLQVRTYVDEILVQRLPNPEQMSGQMFIRGTSIRVPLEFVRLQPYVTPKIELSDQRQERVDVRVLPVIFKFEKPKDLKVFPGQLVDVYLGERPPQLSGQAAPGASPSPGPEGN
ncbi:MAG: HlyD family secretion protein [Bdellovibrionota bacterium]